jgi:2-C-methyl-D-erythritol 2,4-cyclodiphosphate synthase
VVDAVNDGADAAVPALPVTDTLKQVAGTVVVSTPDRSSLVAVQTPQAFTVAALRSAHATGGEATDDAALVEAAGGRVVVVPGDPANVKVTDGDDLHRASDLLGGHGARGVPQVRVGQGFDVHRFSDDDTRVLVLGGVVFPGERGLVGHSDADAVAHAAADALLGAAGLGDLGRHFPDTDDRWRGADSVDLLREVARLLRADGWQVGNVDCAVICERPRLAPRRAEMEECLSAAAGAPVTVKGTRAEGLGSIGRTEGVACLAVATVTR